MTPNPQATPVERFDPEPFRPEVAAFLSRRGAAGEAEDLTQEVLLRGIRHPPRSERDAAQPWLLRIARNLWIDGKRKQRRLDAARPHLEYLAQRDLESAAFVDPIERAERIATARREIQQLPTKQRRALELRLLDGLDYAAVGARIDCSAATARQHFHLAVKTLRARLAAPMEGEE